MKPSRYSPRALRVSPFERAILFAISPVVLCDDKRDQQTITVRCASKPLDASGTGPKWNLVIPMGTYHGPTLAPLGGKFTFTAEFFNELIANWRANGSFRVPTRWGHEHQRNTDPAKAKDLDRKAANLIDLRVTADGLEGLTDWKPRGRATSRTASSTVGALSSRCATSTASPARSAGRC